MMRTAYDNHPNTQLFLDHAQGCTSVLDLFEKIKNIDDTILQGNITEGLVKVMLHCEKFFGMKNVSYAGKNQEGYDLPCVHKDYGDIPVQVKFRSSETLSNDDLNSFGKVNWLKGYEYGYVIGNLRDVPSDWHNDKVMLFLKEDFRDIELAKLIEFASAEKSADKVSGPLNPRGYQSIWLEQMRSNINKMSRGKILGPPGLGKTLGIASYIRMLKKNKVGYVGAPWIRLVNQNMRGVVDELTNHGYNVDFIVVNSANSVNTCNSDTGELNRYNIVKPTTDSKEIRDFIKKAKKDKTAKNLYIVFACYGSTQSVIDAFKGYKLDYAAFDEAHNLTGHSTKLNPQLLYNKNVKFSRRAFVTATEKTYNGENDQVVAMNNAKLFGGILCFCSFKNAIEYKNIKDYRVVFPKLSGKELEDWFSKLKNNSYVQDNGEPVTMDKVALKVMIYSMLSQYPITRMVAGFNRINNAKEMSKFLSTPDVITDHFGFVVKSTWVSSHETQTTNNDRIAQFADSREKCVLCAPPMLKEGVDIKGYDKNGKAQYPNAIVFCDNKRGEIGIVQLSGRGLRMGQNKDELCYIGLPIIYHPNNGDDQKEIYNNAFERAKEVIISLGCNDDRIAQELKTIQVGKSSPKLYKTSTKIIEDPTPIAEDVKFVEFIENIKLECKRSTNHIIGVEISKKEFINFKNKKYSKTQIAQEKGCAYNSVDYRCKKLFNLNYSRWSKINERNLNFTISKEQLIECKNKGMSAIKVQKHFKSTRTTICKFCKNYFGTTYTKWSGNGLQFGRINRKMLLECKDKKMTLKEASEHINCDPNVLIKKCKEFFGTGYAEFSGISEVGSKITKEMLLECKSKKLGLKDATKYLKLKSQGFLIKMSKKYFDKTYGEFSGVKNNKKIVTKDMLIECKNKKLKLFYASKFLKISSPTLNKNCLEYFHKPYGEWSNTSHLNKKFYESNTRI